MKTTLTSIIFILSLQWNIHANAATEVYNLSQVNVTNLKLTKKDDTSAVLTAEVSYDRCLKPMGFGKTLETKETDSGFSKEYKISALIKRTCYSSIPQLVTRTLKIDSLVPLDVSVTVNGTEVKLDTK